MRPQTIPVIFVALILCGCPPKMYGLYRMTNPEPVVVGFECIEDHVRTIPGIEHLVYGTEEGGRPLTWTGIKPASTIHRFRFAYRGEELNFWLEQDWDGKVSYHGGALTTEKKRAPMLIELAQPLYSNIEAAIARCGFDNLDEVTFGDSL